MYSAISCYFLEPLLTVKFLDNSVNSLCLIRLYKYLVFSLSSRRDILLISLDCIEFPSQIYATIMYDACHAKRHTRICILKEQLKQNHRHI